MQKVTGSTPVTSTNNPVPAGLLFFMSFFAYIIYSPKLDRYYIGYTEDIIIRLIQHNNGISTFTAKAVDWKVVYQEKFSTRQEAHKRELQIKAKKSRKYIEWLISQDG